MRSTRLAALTLLWLGSGCAEPGPPRASVAVVGAVVPGEPPRVLRGYESSWCYFMVPIDGRLAMYVAGMDSGNVVWFGTHGTITPELLVSSVAWAGDQLVFANHGSLQNGYYRLDLGTSRLWGPDGVSQASDGVTELDGQLVIRHRSTGRLTTYATYGDLVHDEPSATLPSQVDGGLYHIQHDVLFSTTPLGAEVDVADVTSGDPLRVVPLDALDGAEVRSISVADRHLHVLTRDHTLWKLRPGGRVTAEIGLRMVDLDTRPSGLWCDAPTSSELQVDTP